VHRDRATASALEAICRPRVDMPQCDLRAGHIRRLALIAANAVVASASTFMRRRPPRCSGAGHRRSAEVAKRF
jgi:hypothetical protein